jgi:sugar phosphate isomerase/epimerase
VLAAVIDSVLRRQGDTDATVFGHARRLGFAGVELALGRDDVRGRARDRLESLRRAQEAAGLRIPSLILSDHVSDGGLADADLVTRGHAADDVRTAITLAAELGADIVLVPFFLRGDLDGEEGFVRCVESFRPLCAEAASAGVTLCYEGTLPAPEIRRLAERVGSTAFGCYFDLANPLAVGLDPPTELRTLGGLVRRVHFKESRTARGDARPGLGRVDYAECALSLADIGYDGWLVLETPAAPPALVARDLSYARTFFPALEPDVEWPRFGAFTYDLGTDWPGLAARCRDLGLATVQLARDRLDECLSNPDLAAEVDVSSVGAYRNLIAPAEQERRANLDYVGRCLELAPQLGAWAVSTHAGTRHPIDEWADMPENAGPEAWATLLDSVERLLPAAERAGTVLALEGSVKSVLRSVARTIELLDRFPSPHLQLVCDPYNYVSRALLPARERVARELLGRFEPLFVVAHVKDVGPDGAEVSTPEVGTGVFVQEPYFEFLQTRRPDLPLILEHLDESRIPAAMELVRRA